MQVRLSPTRLTPTLIAAILATPISLFISPLGCESAREGEWSSKAGSSSGGSTVARDQVAPATSPNATSSAPALKVPAAPEESRAAPVSAAAAAEAPPSSVTITETTRAPMSSQPASIDAAVLRRQAIATLEAGSRSSWAQLRANSIEALGPVPESLDATAARGLVDENRGVRFVSAITIARAKRCDLAHLIEPLINDPSPSVRAAAIAALSQCGRIVNQEPLAAMLQDESTEVRANAYLALGLIGNKSAVGLVRSSVGKGLNLTDPVKVRIVELQAAECLVRLGEVQEIEPIRACLFAPAEQGELTGLACQMVGRLHDERSRPLLERLIEASGDQARSAELRLTAADALGRIQGGSGGANGEALLAVIGPFVSARGATLRAQAAGALGATGQSAALKPLAVLLNDPDPIVQVAAAGSILVLTGAS